MHPPRGILVRGPVSPEDAPILSAPALHFVADLVRAFRPRITELLAARDARQGRFDAGERPDFLPETVAIREGDWRCAPLPPELWDRRVEITGPVDRKMIIHALNSGARVFMADFEDSLTPMWSHVVSGQRHLRDAVRGTISFDDAKRGRTLRLAEDPAVLMVRPRGLHLPEAHLEVDGKAVPGCLVDFGLYAFHNTAELRRRSSAPYFYLPKLQSHLEARLWNDVFVAAQQALGVPVGTFKATVLIETLPAAFEMDEILYELRDHAAGLNSGRWDYIFSVIKTLRADPARVLPERGQLGMDQPFLSAYTARLVKVCHRRGVHGMGGMAAQIPIRRDPVASERALAKVRADKAREVSAGHDGTWVAHPGLVPLAREVFDAGMPMQHQHHVAREDVEVGAADLLAVPTGTRTLEGVRLNLRVGVQYVASWLRGLGCCPLYDVMEDAATAEISRAQLWQWRHHGAEVDGPDGPIRVDEALLAAVLDEELERIDGEGGPLVGTPELTEAAEMFLRQICAPTFAEFLTLEAYVRVQQPHDELTSQSA